MNINSTNSSSVINQTFNSTGKNSSKKLEAEEKKIATEIQNIEQKKTSINKEIKDIKDDYATPKPKDEMIRPLQSKIAALETEIQQKQTEKSKIQNEKIQKTPNSDDNKKSNSTQKNIESADNSDNTKNIADPELLDNLITQTGVANEAKLKDNSKNPDVLLLEANPSSDDSKNSDSINSIKDKNKRKYAEDAINAYNLIEHSNSMNSTTNSLA